MDFTGRIKFIGARIAREYNGKTYYKQRLLLTIDEESQYPQTIPFDLMEKLHDRMDEFNVGDIITVSYNIRGNEYDNKQSGERDSFLSLQAWKLTKQAAAQPAPQVYQPAPAYTPPAPAYTPSGGTQATQVKPGPSYTPPEKPDNYDDLPF